MPSPVGLFCRFELLQNVIPLTSLSLLFADPIPCFVNCDLFNMQIPVSLVSKDFGCIKIKFT